MKNLQSIGGDLLVIGSVQLTSLSELDSLNTIGSNLNISNNDRLASLDGLNGLRSLGGSLDIRANPVLNDIQALDAVEFDINAVITITENPQLSVCNITSICNF